MAKNAQIAAAMINVNITKPMKVIQIISPIKGVQSIEEPKITF